MYIFIDIFFSYFQVHQQLDELATFKRGCDLDEVHSYVAPILYHICNIFLQYFVSIVVYYIHVNITIVCIINFIKFNFCELNLYFNPK